MKSVLSAWKLPFTSNYCITQKASFAVPSRRNFIIIKVFHSLLLSFFRVRQRERNLFIDFLCEFSPSVFATKHHRTNGAATHSITNSFMLFFSFSGGGIMWFVLCLPMRRGWWSIAVTYTGGKKSFWKFAQFNFLVTALESSNDRQAVTVPIWCHNQTLNHSLILSRRQICDF